MKTLLLCTLLCSASAFATDRYGNLTKDDQKYFQNGQNEGSNNFERIDKNVAEINKLHGEVEKLKAEMQQLKNQMADLQSKK
jgi:peptidoglycan hydrolase CwlO-like protein